MMLLKIRDIVSFSLEKSNNYYFITDICITVNITMYVIKASWCA